MKKILAVRRSKGRGTGRRVKAAIGFAINQSVPGEPVPGPLFSATSRTNDPRSPQLSVISFPISSTQSFSERVRGPRARLMQPHNEKLILIAFSSLVVVDKHYFPQLRFSSAFMHFECAIRLDDIRNRQRVECSVVQHNKTQSH